MTDFELFVLLLTHCGPWLALIGVGGYLINRAYERYEFRKYEERRRRYSKWRINHLDEIL